MGKNPELSIVLPCRNEEKAIGKVIAQIKEVISRHNLDAEIIVSDSSRDRSPYIARELGARLAKHNKKGYGIALLEGFRAAEGRYIFFADADGTYDFSDIPKFLHYLHQGYDFVIGDRFKGKIERGAMPLLHRYIGNPLLSLMLQLFFGNGVHDPHSGMRAIKKDSLEKLNLKTTGMEFASEMVIKALKNKLKIKEIPINYHRRMGRSKLSSFSDGWRHLRFMLMYAPDYLFLLPGIFIMLFGGFIMLLSRMGPVRIYNLTLYNSPMIVGSFMALVGYQIITIGIYAKAYAVSSGFEKKDRLVDFIARIVTFESGMVLGFVLILISILIVIIIIGDWIVSGFPGIHAATVLLPSLTMIMMGIQTIFSSFFLSMLLVEKR